MSESTKEASYTLTLNELADKLPEFTLNEYQQDAMSVRLESADRMYALLGLAGEVGEIYSLEAKSVRDGYQDGHSTNMKKELGDVLWFVAAIAADNGYTLEDVARANIDKLFSRRDRGVLGGSGDSR